MNSILHTLLAIFTYVVPKPAHRSFWRTMGGKKSFICAKVTARTNLIFRFWYVLEIRCCIIAYYVLQQCRSAGSLVSLSKHAHNHHITTGHTLELLLLYNRHAQRVTCAIVDTTNFSMCWWMLLWQKSGRTSIVIDTWFSQIVSISRLRLQWDGCTCVPQISQ